MVAALVQLADGLEGEVGERADEVHGDLPRHGGVLGTALPTELRFVDLEVAGGLADDDRGRGGEDALLHHVLDRALDRVDVDDLVQDLLVGRELFNDALETPDVVGDVVGDVEDRVVREDEPELGGLVAGDGHARLQIGRLDIRHETPLKAGAQAVVEGGHLQRRPVRGDDDLVAGLVDAVEGVEELVLGLLLAGDELDIVHQKEIHAAVAVMEILGRAVFDGPHELVGKVVALDVGDAFLRLTLVDGVADGQQQVRFPEAGIAVDEKGIVGLARILRHGDGGGVGEAVGVADDEVVKGVARHLGQGVGAVSLAGGFKVVIVGQDQHLKIRSEEIIKRGLDPVAEALLDDLLLELTAGFQHKAAVVQLHGHAVEKPGLHRRRRELLRQDVQHLLPYILDGIHDLNHPSESCSVENLS